MIHATLGFQPTLLPLALASHTSGFNFPERGLSAPRLYASPTLQATLSPLGKLLTLPIHHLFLVNFRRAEAFIFTAPGQCPVHSRY